MKPTFRTAAALTLALAGCSAQPSADQQAATTAERPSDAESDVYMRKAEADWADLAVRNNPGLTERILADDYVGVNSDTVVRDKAKMVEGANEKPSGTFVTSKLDYVNYRHFGDTVLAQGQESLQRKDGGPDLSLIWTDVWMWHDGKWQVVASQDSVLPEKK
jgi:hypothetical protein